ncbi:hypothetical protein C8Q73DRAFT_218392 [Cubamyces lactineus]|nr:hypothetical protein C8Q73DRAFT_218392 [Cubamyces lactineus]
MLRSEMNKRRPIHKLPAEILGSIFQYILPSNGFDLCDSHEDGPHMYTERRMRIQITQVCGRWRAIALGMAAFWNVIDMTIPQWALACFERSEGAKLDVFSRYPLYGTVGMPLGTHSARIRELFIEIPYEHRSVVPTELPAILPPVPNLECLTLLTHGDRWPGGRPIIDSAPRPRIFPYPLLRLTKLVLKNPCWIPGGIPLGTLTHLHISEGTELPLQSLLAFLGQCVSLEKLILTDLRIADALAVPDNLSVELPRLRLLTLGVTIARYSLGCFLRSVVLPLNFVVRIFDVDGGMLGDMEIGPSEPLPFSVDFNTIVIERCYRGITIQAGVWTSTGSSTRASALFLQYQGRRYESQQELAHHLLAPLIPLHQIQYITIAGECCDLTMNLLPCMPRVSVLRIVEPASESRDSRFAAGRLRTALGLATVRFPGSVAFEIWTRRRRASIRLPLAKIKQTYYQIAVPQEEGEHRGDTVLRELENDGSVPQEHHEGGGGDGWKVVEVLNEPVVDLPGLRPARHPYDWW